MRVGAREGFANHSVRLDLMAKGIRNEVHSNKVFLSDKAICPFQISHCPNSDLLLKDIRFCSLCPSPEKKTALKHQINDSEFR